MSQDKLIRTKSSLRDLRDMIPTIEEGARQERETQILTRVMPKKIEEALANFKAGPMQEELRLT